MRLKCVEEERYDQIKQKLALKKSYKDALFELPAYELSESCNRFRYHVDLYKSMSEDFVSQEPIFFKYFIPRTLMVEIEFMDRFGKVSYQGEVNQEGIPHGIGLMVSRRLGIIEGRFLNGEPHGEWKQVNHFNDNSPPHYTRGRFFKGKLHGYARIYQFNTRTIREGYFKNYAFHGELRLKSTYDINRFGKRGFGINERY